MDAINFSIYLTRCVLNAIFFPSISFVFRSLSVHAHFIPVVRVR